MMTSVSFVLPYALSVVLACQPSEQVLLVYVRVVALALLPSRFLYYPFQARGAWVIQPQIRRLLPSSCWLVNLLYLVHYVERGLSPDC